MAKSKGERQRQPLGGPRVKHVCRSASVVLGHPLATFPEERVENETEETAPPRQTVAELPAPPPKPLKPLPIRKKKTSQPPSDSLISMDFWEIYDPDEVCETGFSLIGSESFSVRALCYLCGSAGLERVRTKRKI